MNTFNYELVHPMLGYSYYKWEVVIDGYSIRGEASSIKKAYRNAKRSVKRYKKMKRVLES